MNIKSTIARLAVAACFTVAGVQLLTSASLLVKRVIKA